MESITLVDAKSKRAHIRAAATRLKTYIESFDISKGSRHDITERKHRLTELWNQFETFQSHIESLENQDPAITDKEALLEQQIQQRASFETPYFNLLTRYEAALDSLNRTTPPQSPTELVHHSIPQTRESRVRLPKIELPVFSGEYQDWYTFYDTFDKLIHSSNTLTEVEKFYYLRSSLKDKAADVIKSIEITTDNYQEAWNAIKERFDNKRWIIQKHVRAIFEAPTVTKENHIALRELLDTIYKHLRALKALNRPTHEWGDLLVHIITSKIDASTNKAWEISLPDRSIPDLKSLLDFLSKRCQALEATHNSKSNASQVSNSQQKFVNKSKSNIVANVATSDLVCPQCKSKHHLYHCDTFLKLPINKRLQTVNEAKICRNCLRSTSHQAKACNASSCRKCSKKHNTLLHLSDATHQDKQSSSEQSHTDDKNAPASIVTQCISTHCSLNILLSTVSLNVYDANGEIHTCRALLDSGSQINFITEELAKRLHLKEQSITTSIIGVMEGSFQANKLVNLCIKSRLNNFREHIDCIVLPKITQYLPQKFISKQGITIPRHIKLADPNFNIPNSIDMLIGAETFWRIICAGQIKYAKNQPMFQKTQFGWVISGRVPDQDSTTPIHCHLATTEDLNRTLLRFWEVEHNISSTHFSKEELQCEEHFLQNTRRHCDGRFIVQLPLRTDKLDNLGDSKETAMRRYKALERRLLNHSDMYAEYKKFMQEYKDLGHMREIADHNGSNQSHPSYYLPHHAVHKESSTTTKLRVVFDGSCKTPTGVSLNDALLVGPTIQDDLFSILIRFRIFKYAITADITKMYRQVLVDPAQTSLQRILWRDSIDDPIKTFELLTVTYGTSSASFLAIRSLRKLAEDNMLKYPIGAKTILNDFYVDDLVTGANTLQEALNIKNETAQLLKEGKFELRKWTSNEPALQDEQSTSNQSEFILSSDNESQTRTLGVIWSCNSDEFKFSCMAYLAPLKSPTKRSILSRIALIFDPLGLLGPVTLTAKVIMQDLWRSRTGWDETPPLDLITKWRHYEKELQELQHLKIPRRVTIDQPVTLELHGFSDASEIAYGACIYLRVTSSNGRHSSRLLCSKSRVAPLKNLSIPRLELCAALLLAQLINKIRKSLTCKIDSAYMWTDSTIVLSWIQSCSRVWNSFVANRVGEIQQLTAAQDWHHIRSEDNPADALSRGIMPASLSCLHIWWAGPPWLVVNKEKWPQSTFTPSISNVPERKSTAPTTMIVAKQDFDIFDRYSNFMKLIRVVVYIFRFFNGTKQSTHSLENSRKLSTANSQTTIPISVAEKQSVILRLVKAIQSTCFAKELRSLSSNATVDKNSPIIKLNPFIDDNGILRVGGRLKASSLSYSAKHPMLLPGRHPFSLLIIRHEHERHLHAGPQATLAAIRQNYWLTSARDIVRQATQKCITCFRSSPRTSSAIMGNLPEARVNVPKKPFSTCGTDYAGPFYYKEGSRRNSKSIKCYMAIFVCFATKAVHIELASDLSSQAFLNVFKRFIARRGYPTNIYSDNGLNFVGAERELDELTALFKDQKIQQLIMEHMSSQNVQWHFIPPRAPHHGGLWEAAVKAAKHHLTRITKEAHLKYEELQTLLAQVEAILNSRPLTPTSSDPEDFNPLTPGHFLIGTPLISYPEPGLREIPMNRLSRWQHVEQLRQNFWRRWSSEYLHQCQQRNKWHSQDMSIHKGQIVLFKEDNTPPLCWPLGRILEVHPGQDGIVRVVSVRTAKGIYKRPITRLCLLPFETET